MNRHLLAAGFAIAVDGLRVAGARHLLVLQHPDEDAVGDGARQVRLSRELHHRRERRRGEQRRHRRDRRGSDRAHQAQGLLSLSSPAAGRVGVGAYVERSSCPPSSAARPPHLTRPTSPRTRGKGPRPLTKIGGSAIAQCTLPSRSRSSRACAGLVGGDRLQRASRHICASAWPLSWASSHQA